MSTSCETTSVAAASGSSKFGTSEPMTRTPVSLRIGSNARSVVSNRSRKVISRSIPSGGLAGNGHRPTHEETLISLAWDVLASSIRTSPPRSARRPRKPWARTVIRAPSPSWLAPPPVRPVCARRRSRPWAKARWQEPRTRSSTWMRPPWRVPKWVEPGREEPGRERTGERARSGSKAAERQGRAKRGPERRGWLCQSGWDLKG